MLNRVSIDKTTLTCEVVRQVNARIARNDHPEDGVYEAMVIAHTALCDSCRNDFHEEVLKVREEKSKSANIPKE
jgi:predicted anti-sigma-YlaC factor YlaD